MKIKQNPGNGEILIELQNNEEYDIEEHLQALTNFVKQQAVETYRHTNSYRKIVQRLDELEQKVNQLNEAN